MENPSFASKTLKAGNFQETTMAVEKRKMESSRRGVRRRKLIGEDNEKETP